MLASFEIWTWSAGQDAAPDEWFMLLFFGGLLMYGITTWMSRRKDTP